ncbi:MAG: DNA polymerase/3'-5' exonuclease PolX [Candidatus Nealsonbacteria bacterium]|nr:DNA polymerase/3'-5' exonuclease PolX [Candidatus Nealsonbacteria bacterium]
MTLTNKEIARILYEIADLLAIQEVEFKPQAYQKAAVILESLEKDIAKIYQEGGRKALVDLPGIGESIAEKIEEYLKTGKIKYYGQLKKRFPFDIEELVKIEGMGPQKAKALWQELGIKNVKDLEKAAKAHKIAKLEGFGEKTEKNILEGIAFLKRSKGRFLLHEIIPRVREVEEKLRALKEVQMVSVAGSVRRMKETIGDADLLVVSQNPKKVMDFFTSQPEVAKIWGKGVTKASVRVKEGFDIDLRVVRKEQYGSALQYFTGSKEHNIAVRRIAISKGLKLSEYGLFRGKKQIAGKTEEEIYKALGLAWIPPEMRENHGEIELADARRPQKLSDIIDYGDIRGDLHVHSDWDGGADAIKALADAARVMGYEYIGISDHTKFLKIERGLDEKQLERRNKAIDALNSKSQNTTSKFRILKGCEANIMNDGSIDLKNEALSKLDYVIAGVHSNMKINKDEMTARIIAAMKNPNVDIISHLTGRILKKRGEYEIDFDKILRAAKQFNAILEINASPERLDLNDENIRRAKEAGVKMIINTDTHHKNQLRFMEFGIAQARRGWAEKEDIINTQPIEKLLQYF